MQPTSSVYPEGSEMASIVQRFRVQTQQDTQLIDISAPDGTPVYAVAVDKVFIEDNGHAVAAQAADGRDFVYWHVAPVVRQRSGMTPEGP